MGLRFRLHEHRVYFVAQRPLCLNVGCVYVGVRFFPQRLQLSGLRQLVMINSSPVGCLISFAIFS